MKLSKKAFPATFSLASFHLRQGEAAKAVPLFEGIYNLYGGLVPRFHAEFLRDFLEALLACRSYGRCERIIAQSQSKAPLGLLDQYRVRLYWETGRSAECEAVLQQHIDEPTRAPAAIAAAQCQLRLCRPHTAVSTLRAYQTRHPGELRDPFWMALSLALFLDGNDEEAATVLLHAARKRQDDPKSALHPALVALSLATGRADLGFPHLVSYHERYPKEPWVCSVKVLEGDPNHPQLTDEGRRILDSMRKRYESERNLHLRHSPPLPFLTKPCASSVAALYARRFDPQWPIWWSSGTANEREPLSQRVKRIVLDYTALLVMANVGFLQRLLEGPWDVVVVAPVIDTIIEDASRGVPLARTVWNALGDAARMTIEPSTPDAGARVLAEASKLCDPGTAATLGYAKRQRLTLVLGDMRLAQFARARGIQAKEQIALLESMRQTEMCDPEEWTNMVVKLLREHHLFVPVSIRDLVTAWRGDNFVMAENTSALFWSEIGTHLDMRSCLTVYGTFVQMVLHDCNIAEREKARLVQAYASILNSKMRALTSTLFGPPQPGGDMDAAVGEVSLVVRTIAEVLWTGMWSGNNASLGLVRGALTKGMDVPFLADDLYTAANRIARKAAQEMDLSNVPMSIEGLDES